MEFERSIYRIYEKVLQAQVGRNREAGAADPTKKYLIVGQNLCCGFCAVFLFIWVYMHNSYVMNNDILKPELESQLNQVFDPSGRVVDLKLNYSS